MIKVMLLLQFYDSTIMINIFVKGASDVIYGKNLLFTENVVWLNNLHNASLLTKQDFIDEVSSTSLCITATNEYKKVYFKNKKMKR